MPDLKEEVILQLKQVFDPEIPVNIVDLGLIIDVEVEETTAKVTMTLTSQSCPEARTIPDMVKRRSNSVQGIENTDVEIVWEPAWSPQRITEDGRKILGIEDDEDEDDE